MGVARYRFGNCLIASANRFTYQETLITAFFKKIRGVIMRNDLQAGIIFVVSKKKLRAL
jgi:hypothetical protein